MEERFVVKTELDKKGCRIVARVRDRKFRYVRFAVILLGLLYIVLSWAVRDPNALLYTILLGALASLAAFRPQIQGWISWRSVKDSARDSELRFTDEGIQVSSSAAQGTNLHSKYGKIVETKEYFLLYPQKNLANVLPKADFTVGNPDEFAAFLAEKTGLTVEKLRG